MPHTITDERNTQQAQSGGIRVKRIMDLRPHLFNPKLAEEHGLTVAVVHELIRYAFDCTDKNQLEVEDLFPHAPYLTPQEIRDAMDKLTALGMGETDND